MSADLLFDPLFRVPLVVGGLLALLLPPLGVYLRLRREWLAALGFAHLAGAGGVLGTLAALPVLPLALLVAGGGVLVQGAMRRPGNDAYATMILLGWSVMLIGASFSHHAQLLGQALVDGQLYFAGVDHLVGAIVLAVLVGVLLPWMSPGLLRARLFPGQDQANGQSPRRLGLLFNGLVALGVALGATAMGVMAAFALMFIPAWLAFALAPGWRAAVIIAMLLGGLAYALAFTLAMLLDLPFGPICVACLVAMTPLRLLRRG
ncbi:MAG: metal ABC transporter permease [Ectothiorhodospiraceae bacterium]|nr:metal ABC transporter permease [Ectothiorhodospiraceae bacterium]